MGVNTVSGVSQNYAANYTSSAKKETQEVKDSASTSSAGAVYEKSSSVKNMSKSDRAALVQQLKADQEARKSQMTSLVMDMMNKQGGTFAKAQGEDSVWRFLASGKFTVDAKTKAEAQASIAEDGYWGVEQTSQRIFDFAMALSGGDQKKMDEMRAAFEKGFKAATKSWGSTLPDISQRTRDAVLQKFEAYKNPTGDEA